MVEDDPLAPKGSTRKTEGGTETERGVDSQQGADDSNNDAKDGVDPQRRENADQENRPSDQRETYNPDLESENSVSEGAIPTINRTERFAFWTLLATAGLAVATFILAVATLDMARSTRGLRDFAEQQAHDMKLALDASNRQATAAEEANRLNRSSSLSISAITIPSPTANVKLTGSVGVFNSGRSAASKVTARVFLKVVHAPEVTIDDLAKCLGCGEAMLFPAIGLQSSGLNYFSSIEPSEMTPETVDEIKSKKAILYMQGRVDYNDQDGSQHYILFCNQYQVDQAAVGPCNNGNYAQ